MPTKHPVPALLAAAFLLLLNINLSAQTPTRELGIRLAGLQDFDFIYKRAKAEDRYVRYRVALANLRLQAVDDNNLFTASLGVAIGTEKRRPLAERLLFIHGFEPALFLGLILANGEGELSVGPSLGYVLGFQYDISQRFYVNVETIPALSTHITFGQDDPFGLVVDAGFNSNAIALSLVYRFGGE